jgi:hypothetical protein
MELIRRSSEEGGVPDVGLNINCEYDGKRKREKKN